MKMIIVGLLLVCMSITLATGQIFNTSLKLTVRNELGNAVDSAQVQLFANREDYEKELNVIASGLTDTRGVIKFKDIEPVPYFVLVRKKDRDNVGGGEEISSLEKNKLNKATVIIQ